MLCSSTLAGKTGWREVVWLRVLPSGLPGVDPPVGKSRPAPRRYRRSAALPRPTEAATGVSESRSRDPLPTGANVAPAGSPVVRNDGGPGPGWDCRTVPAAGSPVDRVDVEQR